MSAGAVPACWDEPGITRMIGDMYERYHRERLENAFEDIDILTAERRSAERT